MSRKIFGIPIWFFLIIGTVFASITIIGTAISEMKVVEEVDMGQRKIGERVEKTLAMVNQTITDSVNMTAICVGQESIGLTIKNPTGSSKATVQLNLNGTVSIQDQDSGAGIVPGNITLIVDHKKQGKYECILDFNATNNTVLKWVSEL